MGKEYVPIFFDWLEVTQDLTPEEKGNLIDAVVAYASGQEYEHLLTGSVRIAFRFLKGQVDRNNAISDVRSKARKSNDNKPEQNESNDNKTEENESNSTKEKEKEKENKNKKEKENSYFDQFWAVYPRKVSKETARKAFLKLNPDEDLLAVMIEAIERQKQSPQWRDVQFIPHPAENPRKSLVA